MHKIQRMDPALGPPACLICRRGNTADDPDTLEDLWFMDLERDVNWGDPAYVCKYCCEQIAQECGHVPAEVMEEKDRIISQHLVSIHTAEAERDSLRRRLRAITTGKKAQRSAKRAVA